MAKQEENLAYRYMKKLLIRKFSYSFSRSFVRSFCIVCIAKVSVENFQCISTCVEFSMRTRTFANFTIENRT